MSDSKLLVRDYNIRPRQCQTPRFSRETTKGPNNVSLLRSRFLGCHATLTPKKLLLTTEQHSFPLFDQSQLLFHFRELFRAKFAILNLSNQRSCSHHMVGQQATTATLEEGFLLTYSRFKFASLNLSRNMECGTLSSRRTISSLVCASLICRKLVVPEQLN